MDLPAPRSRFPLLLVCLLAGTLVGCVTRTLRETVVDDGSIEVILRSEARRGEVVDRGFEHPFNVAPVRMAHILSRIDVRQLDDEPERRPAVPTELLYAVAEATSQGLARADSSQEVVVQAVRRSKRFGVFDRYHLTSFLCYVRDDLLFVHFSRSDWEIPKDRRDRLPETHVGEHPLDFRLALDRGMSMVDPQAAAVEWRNPVFARPTRTFITAGGEVRRRTILMEMQDTDDVEAAPGLGELSPATLRALADLEEQRRRGELSETEYNARRNEILSPGPTNP